MSFTAAAIGGGLLLQGIGAFSAAKAQREAARAAQAAFAPSQEEIDFRKSAFAAETRDIARREALIAAIDPAILQAGMNLEDLLKGKEASTLAPLRGQIDRRRAQLRQDLLRRLGPGFETSTAGIQALNDFERQSELALSSAQQSRIGLLGQIAQRPSASGGQGIGLLNASLGQRSGASTLAGLQSLGDLTSAQALSNVGQTLTSVGTLSSIFGSTGTGGPTTGQLSNLQSTTNTGVSNLLNNNQLLPQPQQFNVRPPIPRSTGINRFGPGF